MRISRNWLSDYVECQDLSASELEDLLTTRVAEVDGIEAVAVPVEGAVVAYIKKSRTHPEKGNLHIATLNTGRDEVDVVCGAPNCKEGVLAAYLPPGAKICVGQGEELATVEARSVAGMLSTGVLVSEAELGLTLDHSGIFLFSGEPTAKPGQKLSDVIGGPDSVYVIDNKSLTHRPDLWSHYGFARELAAILGRPLKVSADMWADDDEQGAKLLAELGKGPSQFSVEIEPACGCRRFCGVELVGVSTAQSPLWLRRRLFSVGAGIRNILVDLSNYVMHDVGQPNHTYDADALSGKVVCARKARKGERVLCLDGVERELSVQDIVIADASGPVALGGVIGGESTSVRDSTNRVFLESANFDPIEVRETAKRQLVRTDASMRFEKSRSAYSTPLALHRYSQLICAFDEKVEVRGAVVDCFLERPKSLSVFVSCDYIRSRLDPDVSDDSIRKILGSLGFECTASQTEEMEVGVSYYRATRDISIPDDLVEEVGRVFGYEHMAEVAPKITSTAVRTEPGLDLENRIRDLLRGCGMSEVYNYSFMNGGEASRLGYSVARAVTLENPGDSRQEYVRTTLVPGLLALLEKNEKNFPEVGIFEIGRGYEGQAFPGRDFSECHCDECKCTAYERRLLSIGFVGSCDENITRPAVSSGAGFYGMLGLVRRVVRLVCGSKLLPTYLEWERTEPGHASEAWDFETGKRWMHPYRSASLRIGDVTIGVISEVRPSEAGELRQRAVIAEVDLDLLLGPVGRDERYREIAKYPESFFELSVVMPERSAYCELETLLREHVDSARLRDIELLAIYSGSPLKDNEKSISVKLSFAAEDRTLSGEEVAAIQERLVAGIEQSQFTLRS